MKLKLTPIAPTARGSSGAGDCDYCDDVSSDANARGISDVSGIIDYEVLSVPTTCADRMSICAGRMRRCPERGLTCWLSIGEIHNQRLCDGRWVM